MTAILELLNEVGCSLKTLRLDYTFDRVPQDRLHPNYYLHFGKPFDYLHSAWGIALGHHG